jgi:hypothetical protein
MKTAAEKTTTKKINTVNTKSYYFIINNFIYETDLKTITRKEQLSNILNLSELKNKLLSSPILKQIQMYIKDGFKIKSITEQDNNLIINLYHDYGSIAKLTSQIIQDYEHLFFIATKYEQKDKKSITAFKNANKLFNSAIKQLSNQIKIIEKISDLESKLFNEKLAQHEKYRNIGWGSGMRKTKITISTRKEDSLKLKIDNLKQEIIDYNVTCKEPIKPPENFLPVHIPTTQKKPLKAEQKTAVKLSSKVQPVITKSNGNINGVYCQSTYTRFKTFDSAYKLKQFLDSIHEGNKSMENVAEFHNTGCSFIIPAWFEVGKKERAAKGHA